MGACSAGGWKRLLTEEGHFMNLCAGVGAEYRHFGERKLRFRDVQVGPDGYVYVLAGGDTLYRVEPSGSH